MVTGFNDILKSTVKLQIGVIFAGTPTSTGTAFCFPFSNRSFASDSSASFATDRWFAAITFKLQSGAGLPLDG